MQAGGTAWKVAGVTAVVFEVFKPGCLGCLVKESEATEEMSRNSRNDA